MWELQEDIRQDIETISLELRQVGCAKFRDGGGHGLRELKPKQ